VVPAPDKLMSDDDLRDVGVLFLRQAAAETAHDVHGMETIILRAAPGEPDPVSMIARAYKFWGREAVIEHFRQTFEGVWAMEPDHAAIRILPITTDVAQIYAPCRITIGAPGRPPTTVAFLINEIAVRTGDGWKICTIIPVAAQ
jgi:hypothetical protein